jgi:DNA mismatch repair ATPase MutS
LTEDATSKFIFQFKNISTKLDSSLSVMQQNYDLLSGLMEKAENSIKQINETLEKLARTIRDEEEMFADQVNTLLNTFNFEVGNLRDLLKLDTFTKSKEAMEELLKLVYSELDPQKLRPMMRELVQASLKILTAASGGQQSKMESPPDEGGY